MPSTCPKCHRTVAEDLICCAERQYTWRCKSCRKVTASFALPYGKCYMCGGSVEIVEGYAFEDPMQISVIRDAVQFELNTFHFYRMALARTTDPTLRVVFEILLQNEKEHLHTLQDRYHTHLNDDILNLRPEPEKLMAEDVFSGIDLDDA